MEFFAIIVPMVFYDVLETNDDYQDWLVSISGENDVDSADSADSKRFLAQSGFSFELEDKSSPMIPSQIQTLGYESHSPVTNLGTMTALFIIFFVRVIVVFVFFKILINCKSCKKFKVYKFIK